MSTEIPSQLHKTYDLTHLVDQLISPYTTPLKAHSVASTSTACPSQSYVVSTSTGPHFVVFRHLQRNDLHNGYLQLLGQLTKVAECSETDFSNHFDLIFPSPETCNPPQYFIIVAEDQGPCDSSARLIAQIIPYRPKIIGSTTIFIERKFIRNFGSVGHIEDVVVDNQFRRCGVGLSLVNCVAEIARQLGAYKTILDCDPKNCDFYSCNDFEEHGVQMSKYY